MNGHNIYIYNDGSIIKPSLNIMLKYNFTFNDGYL